jgi:CHAT domain
MMGGMGASAEGGDAPAAPGHQPSLPKPTGPCPVGTTSLHLTDASRPDPWAAEVNAREQMVSLWYPAVPSDGPRARYLTPVESELQLASRGITGVPPDLLSRTRTNAVSDAAPTGDQRRYYPGAAYLGRPAELATGPASGVAVLSRLPGGTGPLASLLHCGCHANVTAPLIESYLLLSGNQQLRIADILSQAQRHDPAGPGFLAVLSACMTDLANADHDEALTLASALLAAGAAGVVGARWPVRDNVTALMMVVMFHHYLSSGHPHPADALRAAQLWMLDRARPVLDGLPEDLSLPAASSVLATPHSWAAFTYQGC